MKIPEAKNLMTLSLQLNPGKVCSAYSEKLSLYKAVGLTKTMIPKEFLALIVISDEINGNSSLRVTFDSV
jgi:hypothetical protein